MATTHRTDGGRHAADADPRLITAMLYTATLFAVVGTAGAEYGLARALGAPPQLAVCIPGALDIYVIVALRVRRDVALAVGAMIAVNAASHLLATGVITRSVGLIVAVSAIAPLVLWRIHALAPQHIADAAEQATDAPPTHADAAPTPERQPDAEPVSADAEDVAIDVQPVKLKAADVVRELYIPGAPRPTTDQIRAVLTRHRLAASPATARSVRLRVERELGVAA